jgi:hypothetical protein
VWSGFTWLRIGIFGGLFECGDEPPSSAATELVIAAQGLTAAAKRFFNKISLNS